MGVAQRLKDLREAAGLSQAELARETGLTRKSIINYENGYREPNSKAMAALERYFHVSGEFLRGDLDAQRFMDGADEINSSIDGLNDLVLRFKQDVLIANQAVQRESINYIRDSLTVLLCAMEQDEFCAKMLTVYASLSAEGQKEMLKRLDEYKCFDLSKHPSD